MGYQVAKESFPFCKFPEMPALFLLTDIPIFLPCIGQFANQQIVSTRQVGGCVILACSAHMTTRLFLDPQCLRLSLPIVRTHTPQLGIRTNIRLHKKRLKTFSWHNGSHHSPWIGG
jgi:hypothetical protein